MFFFCREVINANYPESLGKALLSIPDLASGPSFCLDFFLSMFFLCKHQQTFFLSCLDDPIVLFGFSRPGVLHRRRLSLEDQDFVFSGAELSVEAERSVVGREALRCRRWWDNLLSIIHIYIFVQPHLACVTRSRCSGTNKEIIFFRWKLCCCSFLFFWLAEQSMKEVRCEHAGSSTPAKASISFHHFHHFSSQLWNTFGISHHFFRFFFCFGLFSSPSLGQVDETLRLGSWIRLPRASNVGAVGARHVPAEGLRISMPEAGWVWCSMIYSYYSKAWAWGRSSSSKVTH